MKDVTMKLKVEITREHDGAVEHLGETIVIETKASFLSQKKEDKYAFEVEFKALMQNHVGRFLSGGVCVHRGFGCKPGIPSMAYFDNGCRVIFRYCLKDGICEEEFVVNATVISERQGTSLLSTQVVGGDP